MTGRPPDCPVTGKEGFAKRQRAERAASIRAKSMPGQPVLRVYRCQCGSWHLTHQPRNIRRVRA